MWQTGQDLLRRNTYLTLWGLKLHRKMSCTLKRPFVIFLFRFFVIYMIKGNQAKINIYILGGYA